MHSWTQYGWGTMSTVGPIQLITCLAQNKDRNFHLSQPDCCQTREKQTSCSLIRQKVSKIHAGLFFFFVFLLDDEKVAAKQYSS